MSILYGKLMGSRQLSASCTLLFSVLEELDLCASVDAL